MSADRATMLARAAGMRRAPTEAERRLWNCLRASQLGGHKFRRQATIEGRIVEFFCPAKGLVVEVDGETHEAGRDAIGDGALEVERGFSTAWFGNRELIDNPDGVLEKLLSIRDATHDRWPGGTTPDLSSEEEGRKTA